MLTLIAFFYFAFVYIQEKFAHFCYQVPKVAYACACSIVLSCLLIQGFQIYPTPQTGLNVVQLTEPFHVQQSDSFYPEANEHVFIAKVPEELKRIEEVEYTTVEPFLVAYNDASSEFWNTPTGESDDVRNIAKSKYSNTYTEHQVEQGETLSVIASAYGTTVSSLLSYNPDVKPRSLQIGKRIKVPGANTPKKIPRRSIDTSLRPPVNSNIVNSGYGYRRHPIGGNIRFHHGVDFKSNYGDKVFASMGGKIVEANGRGALGKHIIIRHANGLETVYGHLSRYYYRRGDSVSRGQFIGSVGSTGRTTGPHLHFEIRKNGKTVDPSKYLDFKIR